METHAFVFTIFFLRNLSQVTILYSMAAVVPRIAFHKFQGLHKYLWCIARFSTISTFLKREKHPWRSVTFSKVSR